MTSCGAAAVAVIRASRHSLADEVEVQATTDEIEHERGVAYARDCVYNDISAAYAGGAAAGGARRPGRGAAGARPEPDLVGGPAGNVRAAAAHSRAGRWRAHRGRAHRRRAPRSRAASLRCCCGARSGSWSRRRPATSAWTGSARSPASCRSPGAPAGCGWTPAGSSCRKCSGWPTTRCPARPPGSSPCPTPTASPPSWPT